MTEYRIVKKSMVDVIGEYYFKDGDLTFYHVYCVQYKKWWRKWKDVKGASTCLTFTDARNKLNLIKQGIFTKKGYEVIRNELE